MTSKRLRKLRKDNSLVALLAEVRESTDKIWSEAVTTLIVEQWDLHEAFTGDDEFLSKDAARWHPGLLDD